MAVGWDDARTARAYERFCHRHGRYREANEALASHAAASAGQRILDVGAGTGRTTEALLPHIGKAGSVLCAEPAGAMREAGMRRLRDSRIRWTDRLPDARSAAAAGGFDRVVCGAAIWQLLPLDRALAQWAALLAPGGALVFNIPALYLLEPDRPGGGRDPLLQGLPAALARCSASSCDNVQTAGGGHAYALPCSAAEVERMLAAIGLRAERWSFELRLTQAALRDWLKIPPVSEGFFAGRSPEERERRLDAAYAEVDHRSWRRERWLGWTAWRAQ
ncbi:MAG TPA: class I SAM-dependent methyltransferase [Casimicrobiaceae bacterium]